ncbi:MAG: aldehyde dehydrogenase family protein [Actinobacteria bacterium]|nr:aldehyde dehydrogenase family protein [Actinomycetota bacterium]
MSAAPTLQPVDRPLVVDGRPVVTGAWLDVCSPYSGVVVSRLARGDAEVTRAAIDAAERAMRTPLPNGERRALLERIAAALDERRDEFAAVLCAEVAKPLRAGAIECNRAAGTFRAAAEESVRLAGEVVPLLDEAPARPSARAKVAFTLRKPVGVVGAITPFNFPLNLVAHKVAPALAAGCAVVLKPAEKAPGAAMLLAEVAAEAGLPPGWLNVISGEPSEIADQLADDPRVALITFTGSAAIGHELARRASPKPVMLELGNVTPVIVAADGDVDRAVEAVATSAFGFAGQTCISAQRAIVHETLVERFVGKLVRRAEQVAVGNPADPQTEMGPLVSVAATERLLRAIDATVEAGASLATGGRRIGRCVLPTVLVGAPSESPLLRQEAFGPVVVVTSYTQLDEAIASANASEFGLQAAIFTAASATAMRAARGLSFGAVIVNDTPSFRQDHMPYGGVKHSGNTREGPAHAIREMTDECLVVLDA